MKKNGHTTRRAALLLAPVLVVGSGAALPATDTTTFVVSASIVAACDVTATNLSFGAYNAAAGSPLDGSSTINVYCTTGTGYTVALDIGTGGGTFATRTISGGGNTLNYNLYTSPARTTVWGDGTASTSTVPGTGVGLLTANPHTVYGRIAAAQDQPPASYSSTITVTVTF